MFRSLLSQKYLPIRKLAEGGMGEIYLARQVGQAGFQREVVLKRIHHRLSENPQAVQMFLDEARLAAGLGHPNIVQIYDVGEEDGAYLIVMERVRGVSLRELAETTSRLGMMIPMELSLTVIAQALEGLRHAHGFRDESGRAIRIVHRDICPSNILVSDDGVAKVADFGIARAESQLRREGGPRPGKFAYMSPEAVRGEPMDARADLFSVGVLLYELTVGQRLFRAASFEELRRAVDEPIPPPTFARAGYPVDLELLVMRALERNPDDRFESADAMLEAVEQFGFDTGLRLSRLRLARFVARIMGAQAPAPGDSEEPVEEPGAEPAGDDLDFDGRGLFEPQTVVSAAITDESDPGEERLRGMREAVQQANEAIADLVAESHEPEEGHTQEMRIVDQAVLRARSVEPESPDRREPSQSGLREGSALIVTDELVEEELELSDPGADLLRERPLAEVVTEQEIDLEDLPTSLATPVLKAQAAAAVVEPAAPAAERESPLEPTGSFRREPAPPSADLMEALADISAELRAAAASDRRREVALVQALERRGEAPVAKIELPRAFAPPPATVPPPPASLPPPLLLDRSSRLPAGPLTAIAPVHDELEAADGASRREPDDLERSDFEGPPPDELALEEPQLEADGEPIELGADDDSLEGEGLGPEGAGSPPAPAPPPPAPLVIAPQRPDPSLDATVPLPMAAPAPAPGPIATAKTLPGEDAEPAAGAELPVTEEQPALDASDAVDEDDDAGMFDPTLVETKAPPGGQPAQRGKKRRKRRRRPART